MFEFNDIMSGLSEVVDLGLVHVPTITLISVMLILFGLGFGRTLISYFGVALIFAYYLFEELAVLM